jgi:hypothetical protein
MKTKLQTTKIYLIVLSLFILGCRLLSDGIATPADTDLPQTDQESQPVVTPEETAASTSPSHPGFYEPFGVLMNADFSNSTTMDFRISGSAGHFEIDLSGAVCSLDQPFTLTDPDGYFGVLQFTPNGPGAGSVIISGGRILEYFGDNEGNYTVEDSQTNANILEGNLGLHITTTPACWEMMTPPGAGCFPQDSWIFLTPLETTECGQP